MLEQDLVTFYTSDKVIQDYHAGTDDIHCAIYAEPDMVNALEGAYVRFISPTFSVIARIQSAQYHSRREIVLGAGLCGISPKIDLPSFIQYRRSINWSQYPGIIVVTSIKNDGAC
jgi:hypothetical protein